MTSGFAEVRTRGLLKRSSVKPISKRKWSESIERALAADATVTNISASIDETFECCRRYWQSETLLQTTKSARAGLPESSSKLKTKIRRLENCAEVLRALATEVDGARLILSSELKATVIARQIKTLSVPSDWAQNLPFGGEKALADAIHLTRQAIVELAARLKSHGAFKEPPRMDDGNRRAYVGELMGIFLQARAETIGTLKIGRVRTANGRQVIGSALLIYLDAAGTPILENEGQWPIHIPVSTLRSDATEIKDQVLKRPEKDGLI